MTSQGSLFARFRRALATVAYATELNFVTGATLVDGSTTNARIETLEDTNITTGSEG